VSDVAGWREQVGRSTVLWQDTGRHHVEPGRWLTLSGAPSTDYNVVVCSDDDAGGAFQRSLDDVRAARAPSVIMATGKALGSVQVLVDADWVCIGTTPFMVMEASTFPDYPPDPALRRLVPGDLDAAHGVLADAFVLDDPGLAGIAMPAKALEPGDLGLWGYEVDGRLVTVVASSRVGNAAVFWSLATSAGLQGRGYGRLMSNAILPHFAREGTEVFLHYASYAGERLYRSLGYETVEIWQQWSRPRWIMGRS
jgi:GNAT superfamily N-acetyltransferase